MLMTPIRRFARLMVCSVVMFTGLAQSAELPARAQDLRYGEALYYYHQGALFDALTRMEVAKVRGGIQGHGDHPLLVEGGLLLAYGLHREAKARFEQALSENVDADSRNQAWFYLGKVLYLEAAFTAAEEALARVDGESLRDDSPERFEEWLYLQAQLVLRTAEKEANVALAPSTEHLWWAYIAYNRALLREDPTPSLTVLADQLRSILNQQHNSDITREARELLDRVIMSVGQLHLQAQRYSEAYDALKSLRQDGLHVEQGLFLFSVAAAHLDRHEQALAALNQLSERKLFTPWLQQVPYALAYLYEQMGEAALAYEAFRAAAGHYRTRAKQLEIQQTTLTESKVVAALRFEAGEGLALGSALQETDPYGRLRVQPAQFEYAALLAEEDFQLALRDLHELYKLRASLETWQRQLDSFDTMMVTRRAQHAAKTAATQADLTRLNVAQWQASRKAYEQAINRALQAEDAAFFMNEDQMDIAATLAAVRNNLNALPDDDDYSELKAEFAEKLRRAQGVFDWWLADEYGVNRWAAQKELRGLNTAMQEFEARNATLQKLMAGDESLRQLDARIDTGRERLAQLDGQLVLALDAVRSRLLNLVRKELGRQAAENHDYLVASREAQARLADALYEQANMVDSEGGGASEAESEDKASAGGAESAPSSTEVAP